MKKTLCLHSLLVIILFCQVSACNSGKRVIAKKAKKSKIITDTIFSKSLNERRLISIYLPRYYNKNKKYPVVFCTDGQNIVKAYKPGLDSIMDNGLAKRFIVVGVHSNEKKVDEYSEYRNYEYLKWKASSSKNPDLKDRFKNHLKFFSTEVIDFVEKNYSISQDRKKRLFYGFSNGADFGISLGAQHPLLFKYYICLSVTGGGAFKNNNWSMSNYPFYYLAYGNNEPLPLKIGADNFKKYLNIHNYAHKFWVFNGGHSKSKWEKEFFEVIVEILKKE